MHELISGWFKVTQDVNILHWWKNHEVVLPSLAKQILTIPAPFSKSECVFSTGGNIVTAKRNRLSPKNVESLIKENMAMDNYFMQNAGYIVKNFETESNPFGHLHL